MRILNRRWHTGAGEGKFNQVWRGSESRTAGMETDFWGSVDQAVAITKRYVFTEDEIKQIASAEQAAYEANLTNISAILEQYKQGLSERGFWTECQVDTAGLRFRYSMRGYYGPGGFTSQFHHTTGQLVLGEINPAGDAYQGFYKNDIDQNVKLGADFDPHALRLFVENNIQRYLNPENPVTTREQYERIRALYPHKQDR